MWYYKIPDFELKIFPLVNDKFLLVINDYECDTYADPQIAADNVLTQTTGYFPFDYCQERDIISAIPTDLSAWEKS